MMYYSSWVNIVKKMFHFLIIQSIFHYDFVVQEFKKKKMFNKIIIKKKM